MKQEPRISTGFIILLILGSSAIGLFSFVFSDAASGVPLEGLILTSLIDFIRFIVVTFVIAWFAKEFWNRLIVSIFEVGPVAYREAIAAVLVLGLFFG